MLLEITKFPSPPVVRVQIAGEAQLSELIQLIDTLHDVYATDWPSANLLFDATGMPAMPDDAVQAETGRYLAEKLSHVRKIATVVRPEHSPDVGEQTVRSLGANLEVFHDEPAALKWLNDTE